MEPRSPSNVRVEAQKENTEPKTPDESFKEMMVDAPIPGQSLTNSPDNPMPFERPPEFVNYNEAESYLFERMLDTSDDIIDLIAQGVPLSLLATQAAMAGFAKGKWNPDLMFLLIEPALYTALFIAESSGIDYVLDFDEEEEDLSAESRLKAENHLTKAMEKTVKEVKKKVETQDIEDVAPPSLLAKAEERGMSVEDEVMTNE